MPVMNIFVLPEHKPSEEELISASEFFNLSSDTLLEYQRDYEEHVNSEEVRLLLGSVLEPFSEILSQINVCGYAPANQKWESCFATTSVASISVTHSGEPYMMINLNLFTHLDLLEKITTLAHEKVHLRQILEGRLKMISTQVIWEGEDWSEEFLKAQKKSTISNDQTLYRSLPWEVEAYKKEEEIRIKLESTLKS